MKLAHVSDTHGMPRDFACQHQGLVRCACLLTIPADCEIVVHSGDMQPDLYWDAHRDRKYQGNWLGKHAKRWAKWLDGRPFVFELGNHDQFEGVQALLRRHGIDAHRASWNPIVKGIRFAGHPGVPPIGCGFNNQFSEPELEELTRTALSTRPDILVTHCPPRGYLDRYGMDNGVNCGSIGIRNALWDARTAGAPPRWHLFGHCHEQGGLFDQLAGIKLSNAATTMNIVDFGD